MKFFLLSLLIVESSWSFSQDDIAHKYFQRGQEKYNAGQYKESIADFDKAIAADAKYEDAYYERGRALHEMKYYVLAINDFTKVIEMNPKHERALYIRGYSRFSIENYQGAINDFNLVLELNPKSALAWSYRGEAKIVLGDEKGACNDWFQAYELGYDNASDLIKAHCEQTKGMLKQHANDLIKKGDQKFNTGDYASALAIYDQVVQLYPENGAAYFNKGLAHLLMGFKIKACEDWMKATNLGNIEAKEMLNQHCTN